MCVWLCCNIHVKCLILISEKWMELLVLNASNFIQVKRQGNWKMDLKLTLNLQVVLTPTHLAIMMEYAAGGELFERISKAGRFSEDEVCYLLSLSYSMNVWRYSPRLRLKNIITQNLWYLLKLTSIGVWSLEALALWNWLINSLILHFTGKIFLSAVDFRSWLLSFHGRIKNIQSLMRFDFLFINICAIFYGTQSFAANMS